MNKIILIILLGFGLNASVLAGEVADYKNGFGADCFNLGFSYKDGRSILLF